MKSIRLVGKFQCSNCERMYPLFSDDERGERGKRLCRGCDEEGIRAVQAALDKEYYDEQFGVSTDNVDRDE